MKPKVFVLILIGAIILTAVYPIKYFYTDKNIGLLPNFTTYEIAINDSLSQKIQNNAIKHNCQGYIIPVATVEGPDNSLPYFKEDINLALASYKNWQLTVDEKTQAEIKKRFDNNLKNWGLLFSGDELQKILNTKKRAAARTKYSTGATWSYDKKGNLGDVKLIVTINDELTETQLFEASVTFLHPNTLKKWREESASKQEKLMALQNKADFSKNLFFGLNFLLVAYILGFVANSAIQKKRRRKTEKYLLSEIQKREELVRNGHFVTALELTDKYLSYFPDDIEIKAFRERLLDFTNNDPKTAQIAFVEAQKLKLRLEQFRQAPQTAQKLLLNPEERNSLVPLLPYNTELNSYYSELLLLENQEKKQQEFTTKYENVRELYFTGYLNKASQELSFLQKTYPDHPELNDLQTDIENRKSELEKKFDQVNITLRDGDLKTALDRLQGVLTDYQDMEKAIALQKEIEQAKGIHKFRLQSIDKGNDIIVICQDEIVIGRPDGDDMPDIELSDKRISRNHLRISIVENSVIAEDLGSTGGSFVNGEKIISRKLQHGDVLNLAKLTDMTVFIYTNKDESVGSVLLGEKDKYYLILPISVKFAFEKDAMTFIDPLYAIFHYDDISVFTSEKEIIILKNGVKIPLGQNNYRVEVI
ncbi:MAG: FHA domain-containing protein [bacterium]